MPFTPFILRLLCRRKRFFDNIILIVECTTDEGLVLTFGELCCFTVYCGVLNGTYSFLKCRDY